MAKSRERRRLTLSRLALLLWGLSAPAMAAPPVVEVEGGPIAGIAAPDAAVNAYLGIPFAAPPVGALRWRAPESVRPWQGTRSAEHFGASCIQPEPIATGPWTREFYAPPPYSEDCLFLNVWTPARRADAHLPVVVWIHGGGFTQGGANEAIYYGGKLAERGVVFVSINYRVGLFGFFGHPELAREAASGSAGNYAFLDEIAALRWVQHNIAGFGGDPAQVTVEGQSAGASSVGVLLASPLAKGMLHRVIAESGLTLADPSPVIAQATLQENGVRWAQQKGLPDLQALRALPPEQLIQGRDAPIQFGPAVDGYVLPATPTAATRAGALADVPVLTGYNAAEGAVPLDATTTAEELAAKFRKLYGNQAEAALKLYDVTTGDASRAAQQGGHDRVMMGAFSWAAARGQAAHTPLYLYSFDHVMPGPTAARWGAFHSSEICYAFGTLDALDRPFSAVDRRVSDRLMGYWLNFIQTGDPNGPGLPEWRSFSPEATDIMHLGATPVMLPVAAAAKMDFLARAIGATP